MGAEVVFGMILWSLEKSYKGNADAKNEVLEEKY